MSRPAGLGRRGVRRALQLATYPTWPLDRALLRRAGDAPLSPPPVFIVGAPRCGSTVLYQVMANQLEVTYISNLAACFYHSLAVGLRVHEAALGRRAFNRFDSVHGTTEGLDGPSECGRFWHRWFPSGRDFVAADEIPAERLRGLRRTFVAAARAHGRPLVIKNLNCGQRLQVLRRVLPEALVVFCRRDPVANAASLLNGRLKATGGRNGWWSVRPRDVARLEGLPWWDQLAGQVHSLEAQIREDLREWPREQWIEVHYEALCAGLPGELERLRAFMAAAGAPVGDRPGAELPRLRCAPPRTDDPQDLERIRAAVARLEWPA